MYRTIDLSDMATGDRFAGWQSFVSGSDLPVEFRTDRPDDFRATIATLDLGAARVSALSYSPVWTNRTARLIRQFDPEHYQLTLCRRGTLEMSQAGRDAVLGAGDLVLYDTWRPFHGTARAAAAHGTVSVVQAQIPRHLVPLPPGRADGLTAVRLPTDAGVGALLGQFLTRLADDAADYRAADASRLGDVLLDLLTALLAHHLETEREVPQENRDHALLARIHAHIEQRLNDATLSPRTIAAANHISVRTLHRLFERRDSTVSGWIRARRLEHCRRDLSDPRNAGRSIRAIAARWGFTDAANFTRAFRAAYGRTPQDHRRETTAPGLAPPAGVSR